MVFKKGGWIDLLHLVVKGDGAGWLKKIIISM
jgi:hypothetical protein